ncbi:hypothetical protein D2L64_01265 [Micromonospora radicis]|uniref:Thiamine pyrophosphate-binding protein n=1 Tax=Micromonospora radicis TaxID=1894971 RepID=A0A418N206_9ACTN|nr:hypothetical protein D2L64_01265 [Micromonospora radicis]
MADPVLAEAVVARLAAWRVPRVFGHPGETAAPLVEALSATGGEVTFVPTRPGASAALMAVAHARLTGGVGVCLASAGASAYGLLAGLDAARQHGLPVLAIVAEHPPVASADDRWGPVDRSFGAVCRRVFHAVDPARGADLVEAALRDAVAGPGPVCLVVPAGAPGRRRTVVGGGAAARLVFEELRLRLPRPGIVAVDGEPNLARYAHRLPPGTTVLAEPGGAATGAALPAAVAAKLAAPERPVLALVTDDGMRSHGLAELVTVARGWPQWPDPRLVVLVFNTRSGHPGRQLADDVPYAGWARLLGLHGVRVDRPELVGAAWDGALTADRPCVLDVVAAP